MGISLPVTNTPHLLGGANPTYAENILATYATGMIGFWQCGIDASDSSAEANNGTDVGTPAYNQTGIGDGSPSVLFDGATNAIKIGSAGLAADINYNTGSLLIWAKRNGATVGTDYIVALYFGSLWIYIQTDNANLKFVRKDNTSQKTIAVANTTTAWQCLLLTWDTTAGANGEMKAFIAGAQVGSTQQAKTASGAMVQTWTCIGAQNTTPTNPFAGYVQHCVLWAGVDQSANAEALATL